MVATQLQSEDTERLLFLALVCSAQRKSYYLYYSVENLYSPFPYLVEEYATVA